MSQRAMREQQREREGQRDIEDNRNECEKQRAPQRGQKGRIRKHRAEIGKSDIVRRVTERGRGIDEGNANTLGDRPSDRKAR